MAESNSTLLVRFSDALKTMMTDAFYEKYVHQNIPKDDYISVLRAVFKEELEFVPHDTERHVFLCSITVRLVCEICDVKLSTTQSLKACKVEINKHVFGRRHQASIENLGDSFTGEGTKFYLLDTCPLPTECMAACFNKTTLDHKKYLKGFLYPNFECHLCKHKFIKTNNVNTLRASINEHIYGRNHSNLYLRKFPRCHYKMMSSTEAVNELIGYLHNQSEATICKDVYKTVMDIIYQSDKFNLIMMDSVKSVRIRLNFQLGCLLCDRVLTSRAKQNIDKVLRSHLEGKSHRKLMKSEDSFRCIEEFKESKNMLRFPGEVMSKITKIDFYDHSTKAEQFITYNVEFDVYCMICDSNVIRSKYISNVQKEIDNHIYCKKHINNLLNEMII